jgi:hypothetical protein
MKYLNFKMVAIFMSLGLLAAGGCSDANVELVKNGCFDSHKEVTIGTILQERFDDCKWSSGNESGRTVVTFTGKISKATHDLAAKLRENDQWYNVELFVDSNNMENSYPEIFSSYKQRLKNMGYLEKKKEQKKIREEQNQLCRGVISPVDSVSSIKEKIESEKETLKELKIQFESSQNPSEKVKLQEDINRRSKSIEEEKERLTIAIKDYQLQEQYIALRDQIKEMKLTAMNETFQLMFWTTSSGVELKWIIYPDGKTFEIEGIANNSWSNFRLKWGQILKVLFAK